MMPELDGFGFVERLRAEPAWRTIPVLVVTAKDLTPEERLPLNGWVEQVLQKGAYSRERAARGGAGAGASIRAGRRLTVDGQHGAIGPGRQDGADRRRRGGATMAKILLVEDNEMNRDMLSRRLQRRGHEVLVRRRRRRRPGGRAAARCPALILMDMSLPIVDGWEATRQLKADPATSAIPIIALTAHAMSEDRERALAAGCDDYDTKPIEFARLVGKIDALLDGAS